eukprot:TRINITY_DN2438_c0_g1_i1.p1 TRINITY_DN2438_c0_g1~~TRINITY_DN2438_c0_g1_i1.p1  ORF type:complete len:411 (-),score=91.11 TRINITY_DN2438_c0_g1_i1:67-1299(-)
MINPPLLNMMLQRNEEIARQQQEQLQLLQQLQKQIFPKQVKIKQTPTPPLPETWRKTKCPADGRSYDIVAPVLLGNTRSYLTFDFDEGREAAVQTFLHKVNLPAAMFRAQLLNHLDYVIQRVVTQARQGKKYQPLSSADADAHSLGVTTTKPRDWIPKETYAVYREPLNPLCLERLGQFNAVAEGGRLTSVELASLRQPAAHAAELPDILTKLVQWPPEHAFPVLDVFRALLLDKQLTDVVLQWQETQMPFVDCTLMMSPEDTSPFVTHVMALHALTNAFAVEGLREGFSRLGDAVLDRVAKAARSNEKVMRASAVNLLSNFAVNARTQGKDNVLRDRCVEIVCELLRDEKDEEVAFTAVVVLGTLVADDSIQALHACVQAVLEPLTHFITEAHTARLVQAAAQVHELLC